MAVDSSSVSAVASYESLPNLMQSGDGTQTLTGFFDLAVDPRTASTATAGLRGPLVSLTLAPTGTDRAESLLVVGDNVYDVLEVGTASTSFMSVPGWQDGSTVVGTVYTLVRPDPVCTANNTPAFIAPTVTEVFCSYAQAALGACSVKVTATTVTPSVKIKIISSHGFTALSTGAGCSSTVCDANCGDQGLVCPACCPIAGRKDYLFSLPQLSISDVGRFIVQCFTAVSVFDTTSTRCYSTPTCVKFHIYGSAPRFVDPTPLAANSEDDYGVLVKGRTDVPACLGYPLQLTLHAVDDDAGDQVRIFVEDKFNTQSAYDVPACLGYPLQLTLRAVDDDAGDQVRIFVEDKFNTQSAFVSGNFFLATSGSNAFVQPLPSVDCASGYSTWKAFGALRVGDNAGQSTLQTMDPLRAAVNSPYNAGISFAAGAATQSIKYTLACNTSNGVNCTAGPPFKLNLNPVICGFAYDSSRARYGRWVGLRNPDRRSQGYLSDHSMGDYA
eukprot:CAMPEP_0113728156 /NCGR_PEP_ID=MMETSP0038_2-20120614/41690_1 /TAXON_ID=2898 /ORGANISM="Cryptomonas paramecium" /LENGTH=498 /DNA_ID=CAMNT_0000659561 /DNA_START=736 /DNA_END=2228 /DNA_ORIENTATION=+ /assembly_acc=CAM_ASM_000170